MNCMICENSRTLVSLSRGDCDTFCKILNIKIKSKECPPDNCPMKGKIENAEK